MKSVGRDTALLLFTLRTAGPLPDYMTRSLGPEGTNVVAKLVLDRILEIEWEGAYLSGVEAHRLLQGEEQEGAARGVVARLSVEAIKYAQALDIADSIRLSTRMYLYNRLPASPAWKRRFPSTDAVAEHLEVHRGGKQRVLLERAWVSTGPVRDNPGWLSWSARDRSTGGHGGPGYKLYVSPRCEGIREAFAATLEAIAQAGAHHFKIGNDIYGILRPDKLVAYFDRFEAVQDAAGRLGQRLKDLPAHGVPFTAALDKDGLLSWGMDPPREQHLLAWQGPSWRRWITDRLAVSILSAKAAQSGPVEPWQFALNRLKLEGIDPSTWTPTQAIWDQPEPPGSMTDGRQ